MSEIDPRFDAYIESLPYNKAMAIKFILSSEGPNAFPEIQKTVLKNAIDQLRRELDRLFSLPNATTETPSRAEVLARKKWGDFCSASSTVIVDGMIHTHRCKLRERSHSQLNTEGGIKDAHECATPDCVGVWTDPPSKTGVSDYSQWTKNLSEQYLSLDSEELDKIDPRCTSTQSSFDGIQHNHACSLRMSEHAAMAFATTTKLVHKCSDGCETIWDSYLELARGEPDRGKLMQMVDNILKAVDVKNLITDYFKGGTGVKLYVTRFGRYQNVVMDKNLPPRSISVHQGGITVYRIDYKNDDMS